MWLKALESGEFKQTTGWLQDGDSYCCLGVACRVSGIKHRIRGCTLDAHPGVQTWLGLRDCFGSPTVGQPLVNLNDRGTTFKEIAQTVRANPENYFVKPANRDSDKQGVLSNV
jgi:hypothetical protein